MSAIVWLASYPKSGNTWVRILLANYLSNGDQPVDINDLGLSARIASARRTFDEWCGVEASALPQAEVDRLRPQVYRCLAAESTEDLFFKVHDAWSVIEGDQPMFPPELTSALIYIVRNPLDVAVSAAHHWRVEMKEVVERMCDPGHGVAGADSRLPDQLRQFLGCWSGHARSWLDDSGLDGHVVRYEDLRRHPEQTLEGILEACAIARDRARVRRAVAFSDFGELQRQERIHGFRERPLAVQGGFFRRGEVGAWREELSAPFADRLVREHHETMGRFGYLEDEVSSDPEEVSG